MQNFIEVIKRETSELVIIEGFKNNIGSKHAKVCQNVFWCATNILLMKEWIKREYHRYRVDLQENSPSVL